MKTKQNKSLFLEQFGDTPQLRVIDFMIENHFFDFPLTEIARESNVSYNSLKTFIDKFVETGFFIKTRKIRKSDYFKLNTENSFVLDLIRLDWSLTKAYALRNEKPIVA
jgi:predicted transcriptional regulator